MKKIEDGRFYNDRQVARAYGIGRSTVWAWVAQGILPAPEKIGPRTSRWSGKKLLEWEQSFANKEVYEGVLS